MSDTPLFTAADLAIWLDVPVDNARAAVLERVVWGWLRPVLQATVRPTNDEQVFAWAVELGGIAHENPANLASYQLGAERAQYSLERRNAILGEVAAKGVVDPSAGSGVATPLGDFPPARTADLCGDAWACWP